LFKQAKKESNQNTLLTEEKMDEIRDRLEHFPILSSQNSPPPPPPPLYIR
jgi:hypothetical protein